MAPKDTDNSSELHSCYICWAKVASTAAAHEASARHRAASTLAAAALARLRAQLTPSRATKPAPTGDQHSGDAPADTIDTCFAHNLGVALLFCGSCAAPFSSAEREEHSRSKEHLKAALEEITLDELAREYVDQEDLAFLEPSSNAKECGSIVTLNEAMKKKYTCHMCAKEIPEVYRDEHEQSSRHRSCVALANAAAKRTGAFLERTTTDLPLIENYDKIFALLKAYAGIEILPLPDRNNENKREEINAPETCKKRLTSKEYFTKIMPFLQYVGTFCTLTIDDTDYVTIKTAEDTLRVHVVNFNGLYNEGMDQMKCNMCNSYENASYSSEGDMLHVMSLGHIKRVLTPIDNVHGIRKINEQYSLCILCNVIIFSSNVENHIMNDIQHTATLTEALERGRAFKESENDLKMFIYSPVEKYVKKSSHVPVFPNLPPLFGSATHQGLGPPNQNDYFSRKPSLFGFKPQKTGFGQPSNSSPQTVSSFGSAPSQQTGFGPQSKNLSENVQTTQNNTLFFGSKPQQSEFGHSGNSLPQKVSSFGMTSTQQTGQPSQNLPESNTFVKPAAQLSANVQTNQNNTSLFGSKHQQSEFGQPGNSLPQKVSSLGIAANQQPSQNLTESNTSSVSAAQLSANVQTNQNNSTLFGSGLTYSLSHNNSSFGTANTKITDSSQNQNNSLSESNTLFSFLPQQAGLVQPNRSNLPGNNSAAFSKTAPQLTSNQNDATTENVFKFSFPTHNKK